jgi:hypothetical protein
MPKDKNKPKEILTGEGTTPVQGELAGFEQKRVQVIENWAAKFDAKRELINGLKGELANIELKLREAVHANADKVDQQKDPDGGELLVYKRGDINVVVKRGKETVNVKVGETSKGDPGVVAE